MRDWLIRREKDIFQVIENEGKPTFFKLATTTYRDPVKIPLKLEEIARLFLDFLAGRAQLLVAEVIK